MQLRGLDITDFLANYWQQRPLVIRQALPGFTDLLDEHDLAGLSQDPDVDSRIISHQNKQWALHHGPFDDFDEVCQGQWTLLVQGVDRYLQDASELMEAFAFLPYWRMDDLMVSYAVPGAGVGPHLDAYDVFLVQGQGRRHWQVGQPGEHDKVSPHPGLAQVAPFEPVLDVVLEPGDILYIPPGWPHDGVTVEAGMTYSVGFRAPDQEQLAQVLPAIFEEPEMVSTRFCDPHRQPPASKAALDKAEIGRLTQLLLATVQSEQWPRTLARMLSEQHLPDNPPEQIETAASLAEHLAQGAEVHRSPGCRPLFLSANTDPLQFFVNGEAFCAPQEHALLVIMLLEGAPLTNSLIAEHNDNCTIFELFAKLVNKGYWELVGPSLV